MSVFVSVLITFVLTLGLAAAGWWQWQRSHSTAVASASGDDRIATLGDITDALDEAEANMRSAASGPDPTDRLTHLRGVSLLIIRSAPLLEEDEQTWAVSIVQLLSQMGTTFRDAVDNAAVGLQRDEWWILTVAQPKSVKRLFAAASELKELQDLIGARYDAVARGAHA